MFLFSWTPACLSAWSCFQDGDLAFCILAGALEASQIYNTEREHEHTEAPLETAMPHDELCMLAFLDLQVVWFVTQGLILTQQAADGVTTIFCHGWDRKVNFSRNVSAVAELCSFGLVWRMEL